jgi:hypothetical protein
MRQRLCVFLCSLWPVELPLGCMRGVTRAGAQVARTQCKHQQLATGPGQLHRGAQSDAAGCTKAQQTWCAKRTTPI